MNIYQMYNGNNFKLDFWVRRDTWDNYVAQVISIEGVTEGEKIPGKWPYYGNRKVFMRLYRAKSLELVSDENFVGIAELVCPGNYSYTRIDKP